MDQGSGACARRRGCPRRSGSAPAIELALEMLDEQRIAVAACLGRGRRRDGPSLGFPAGIARRAASAICWRSPPTPWSATSRHRRRNTRGGVDIPRTRSCDRTPGRGACRRRPGHRVEVRDGEKGPLVVEVVKRRVRARTETGGTGPEETLFVTRERQADGTFKHDYYLSNCRADVPLEELARRGQGGASDRRMLGAGQGGGGPGRLSGEELDRLASSSDPVAAGRVVPESGDAAGKKSGPPR